MLLKGETFLSIKYQEVIKNFLLLYKFIDNISV